MLRRSGKLSIVISVILGALFLVALGVAAYWLPVVVNSMIDVPDNIGNRGEITQAGRAFILADAYVMLAVAATAVVLLFVLLRVVYTRRVFSRTASGLISAVSWCCFGEGGLAMLLFGYFQLVACAALAAFFLGLCLRVVMHVIEEATRIKQENDYTI